MATQADELTFPLPGSAGVVLPHTARLKTVENTDVPVPGGATMALFNSTAASGAVYLVVLKVDAVGGPGFLVRIPNSQTHLPSFITIDFVDIH
jgi:hypothetical protein